MRYGYVYGNKFATSTVSTKLICFSFSLTQKPFEILNDKRRLTVAVSRAKEKLILIGCIRSLKRYEPLSKLISLIQEKDLIVTLQDLNELKKFEQNI